MNIYRIWQTVNQGYDSYDSAIVRASTPLEAKTIHPSTYRDGERWWDESEYPSSWAWDTDQVQCEKIGEALADSSAGLILSSFNAG